MSFQPTDEQAHAAELAATGEDMVVEALAGTGKTTTSVLMAEQAHTAGREGLYVAFNKAIVEDGKDKFPESVLCSTVHGMAMRAVGKTFAHRLGGGRMKSRDIADLLGITPLNVTYQGKAKRLSPSFLAGLTMRAMRRFSQTDADKPSRFHVPWPEAARAGEDGKLSSQAVDLRQMYGQISQHLEPFLQIAWMDLSRPDGRLPYDHNYYLKYWQMSDPVLEFDYVLVDEAQDMNPVMRSIIDQQDDLQKIWIGDSRQQIYEWNGSVNAMSHMDAEHRAWLTQSFRFGPEIAEEANKVLRALGCEVEITGSGPEGFVGLLNEPGVILSRTNAKAVSDALHAIDRGLKPHVVGGTSDVVGFCRAAKDLMDNNWTSHPELACFDNWTDVIMYVHEDELGGDLALLVGLIEEFGADRIIGAMSNQPKESEADLVLSTAHKSKGREWESVKLASDFKDEPSEEEMRLLYVANTRAMKSLDNQDVDWMRSE